MCSGRWHRRRASARPLHSACVVSGCEHNGGDAVHDAFVVGCPTIRVGGSQRVRVQETVNNVAATQSVSVKNRSGPGQSHIRFVGENAEQ
jgi:hypothetical protein